MKKHRMIALPLVLLLGGGITSCSEEKPKADILSYSVGDDPLDLILTVATGPGIELIPSVVDENDEQLTIEVVMERPEEPTPDVLTQAKVSMVLDEVLGSRQLIGPNGQLIERSAEPDS